MSPHRIADAARISPYPSTIRAQESERPDALANSASGSGASSSKARLMAAAANTSSRSTRTTERSSANGGRQGQDEDVRFNIGPRNIRNLMSRRNGRGGRSGRAMLDGIEEGVPNYPPPSFQEAVGTPLLSSSMTSQSSSLPASLDTTGRRPVERQHDMSESESSMSQGSPSETPSASESEDSLEIIETVHPPGLSTRGQENGSRGRQGIEFPCPSPSVGSTTCVNASISPLSESGLPRGRAKTKLKSVLDLTEDIPEPEPEPSPVRSTKKRFLSLSPLRTLFPPKHQALQARALSAHPSPGTSPYATPRSTHFFRSTTSLASSSVLRLPFAGSTLTLTANKPESAKPSKKFFHSKEKEREREHDECSSESLDSWEFLESEDSRRIDNEPRSLMAMIAPVPDSPSPVLGSELSPARSLSFTYGAPPTPTTHSPLSPMISQPVSAPAQTQPTTTSWNEPHPLSLRDRKVAEAIEPFLRRRPRRDGTHHRSRTTPNPIVAVPPIPPGAGPPVTTVRTRMNPSNHQNNQSTVNADTTVCLTSERCEPITASGGGDSTVRINDNTHDFQRALETPLPSSPIRPLLSSPHTKGTSAQSSPSPVMINISSPTTPIPARGGAALDVEEGSDGVQPSPVPTPKAAKMLDTPIQRPTTIGCVCKHSPTAKALAPIQDNSASSLHPSSSHSQRPLVESTMSSSPSQAGRRHYPGRPLPRPPQPQPPRNVVVDSIYAGHEAFQSQTSGSPNTTCPEGLLIDLENDEDPNVSGAWTPPMDDHSHPPYPPSGTATPNRSSPIGSSSSTPDPSIRSLPLSFSSGNASSLSGLSEMTDLDLLAAALGDGNNGADYETLVLISDFLGPADEARTGRDVGMGTNSTIDESNVPLTGRVEVQRRRVTSDGRVKLKMSVFGVSVNQCGICISQFREGQHASMSPSCQHMFHENCLRQWLVRSKTCPLCRVRLDSGNR